MPQLFTIRWPLFARLDAVLLFPLAFLLAGGTRVVASLVNPALGPSMAGFVSRVGLPGYVGTWLALAIICFVPYVLLLAVFDRALTIRKGFALLSMFAIVAWAKAGAMASGWLSHQLPDWYFVGGDGPSFDMTVALMVGALAMLLHIKPLIVGFLDDGRVAERLVAISGDSPLRAGEELAPRYARTRAQESQNTVWGTGPSMRMSRRSPVTTVLYAVTWAAVVGSVGVAWTIWNSRSQEQGAPGALPSPRPATNVEASGTHVRQPVDIPPQRAASIGAPSAAIRPARAVQSSASAGPAETPGPMPAIQRPGGGGGVLPMVVSPSATRPASNEAVAERGRDGGFIFSSEINGVDTSVVFDTGASVVGLRAEDAVKMGYVLDKLNFSAKVKTANGTAEVAPVIIGSITIGNITQRNVVGFVARPGALHENLLGQSFLARLAGFGVEGNRLVLKGH